MNEIESITTGLVGLSRELGEERRELAILAEGNTSAKLPDGTFLVKASGSNLGTMTNADLVQCSFAPLLEMLDRTQISDAEVEEGLMKSRVNQAAKKPSVECLFHAWLLSQPGIEFVGHVHSIAINRILCSPRAGEFATHRLFPDEVVCCGPASLHLGYVDPGLDLAKAIREGCGHFQKERGILPKVILLQNHGVIAPGRTSGAVKAAIYMADKAARIFEGAARLRGPEFLTPEQVARIAGRSDEHYRQRILDL